jgi:hypothetical protein
MFQVSWMDKIVTQGGDKDLINMQTHPFAATVPDTVPQSTCSMHQVTKLAPDKMLGLLYLVFGSKRTHSNLGSWLYSECSERED